MNNRPHRQAAKLSFPFVLTLLLVSTLVVSCGGRRAGSPLRPGFNTYSPEQDIALGKQLAPEVRRQAEVVPNAYLQRYISRLGHRLAQSPQAGQYPYSFTVLNDPSVNAFALPGGPIFVNSGLVKAADNEAELAGVMAHEIAHVALRHATSQVSKANLLQLPAVLAGAVIGSGSIGSELARLGLGFGLQSALLKNSRTAESEADALGARIMAQAGYNPEAIADFFDKLEKEGVSRAPEFLSDHPNPGNRKQAILAEMQTFPLPRRYRAEGKDFARVKAIIGKLPPPAKRVS